MLLHRAEVPHLVRDFRLAEQAQHFSPVRLMTQPPNVNGCDRVMVTD